MKKFLVGVLGTMAVLSAIAFAESRVVVQGKDSTLKIRDVAVSTGGVLSAQVTDSTGTVTAAVTAASTAAAAADKGLVVSVSPNSTAFTNPAAQTSGTWTEVLVLTSSTSVPTTPLVGRRAIEIQNNGPNAIWCRAGGGTPTVGVGRRLAPMGSTVPSDSWAFDAADTVVVKCIAATANQVTTAATSVQELK